MPFATVAEKISRNGYEGSDPRVMPDTLTLRLRGRPAGMDIASLAALLLDLLRRWFIDNDPSFLNDFAGLETLADA